MVICADMNSKRLTENYPTRSGVSLYHRQRSVLLYPPIPFSRVLGYVLTDGFVKVVLLIFTPTVLTLSRV